MCLLEQNAGVHFGDVVFSLPNGNNGNGFHQVISCREGQVLQHDAPNLFLTHAAGLCKNIKKPEIIQINSFEFLNDELLPPYCPSVIALGAHGNSFGVLAVGSYVDREVVRRNSKLFEVLGLELSLALHLNYLNEIVEDFLFKAGDGDTMAFETLLASRFRKLLGNSDESACRNILSNVMGVVEKIMITLALEKAENKIGEAASILGINRNTLRKKIHQFNLDYSS